MGLSKEDALREIAKLREAIRSASTPAAAAAAVYPPSHHQYPPASGPRGRGNKWVNPAPTISSSNSPAEQPPAAMNSIQLPSASSFTRKGNKLIRDGARKGGEGVGQERSFYVFIKPRYYFSRLAKTRYFL